MAFRCTTPRAAGSPVGGAILTRTQETMRRATELTVVGVGYATVHQLAMRLPHLRTAALEIVRRRRQTVQPVSPHVQRVSLSVDPVHAPMGRCHQPHVTLIASVHGGHAMLLAPM
jgi:hypothetical protein